MLNSIHPLSVLKRKWHLNNCIINLLIILESKAKNFIAKLAFIENCKSDEFISDLSFDPLICHSYQITCIPEKNDNSPDYKDENSPDYIKLMELYWESCGKIGEFHYFYRTLNFFLIFRKSRTSLFSVSAKMYGRIFFIRYLHFQI
jgi:hypothetical protein